MSLQGKTFKHFVIVRFFPYQDATFTQDIFNMDFISQQILLAKNNCLKSLENQSNKNFEIVFLANEKYFANKKFDVIFNELKDATSLPVKFIKCTNRYFEKSELPALINAAYDEYDFVIQSRIDLDDFIYKDAVTDTQNKIEDCDSILVYGYCRGYSYFKEKIYPYHKDWHRRGHPGILQSLIVKSSVAKNLPFVSIYSFKHTNVKREMKEFLNANGLVFSENMFRQNTAIDAYIYFRHDFSYTNKGLPFLSELPKSVQGKTNLTDKEITKKQLEDEFGFHYDVKF